MNSQFLNPLVFPFLLAATGFFLNLLWEVLHSLLYDWDRPPLHNNIYRYIPRIVFFASLFDAVFILLFSLGRSFFYGGFSWIATPVLMDFVFFCALGIVTAIVIELLAIRLKWWHYHKRMPTIFGMGLTPLVQLALTSSAALTLVSWGLQ